jgi:hypothetical protein
MKRLIKEFASAGEIPQEPSQTDITLPLHR